MKYYETKIEWGRDLDVDPYGTVTRVVREALDTVMNTPRELEMSRREYATLVFMASSMERHR